MNGEHPSIPLLEELAATLKAKANDYAASSWDDNFTGTAELVGVDPEQVFHTLIGVKVQRLKSLLGTPGKKVQNEPIDDTLLDLANYAILWLTYRRQGAEHVFAESIAFESVDGSEHDMTGNAGLTIQAREEAIRLGVKA